MITLAARALKQLAAAFLYHSGFLGLWWRTQGRMLRSGPLIVTYHRVLPAEAGCDLSQPGIVVSTRTFARQVQLLTRLFRPVPLGTAARSDDPELCAITFDDGWRDNHAHALPVLKDAGVAATLFVVTDLVGTDQLFWPERLSHLLAGAARRRLNPGAFDGLPAAVHAALVAVTQAADAAMPVALDHLIETAKAMGEREREEMLDLLVGQTGRETSGLPRRLLDWDEVRALQAAGVEIGAHGATHAILTRVERARAVAEIQESRRRIEQELGTAPLAFAYPNGDASPVLAQAVKDAGFSLAVVTDAAPDPGCPRLFAIRRKNLAEGSSRGVSGFSGAVFACEVLGFFDMIRQRSRRRPH